MSEDSMMKKHFYLYSRAYQKGDEWLNARTSLALRSRIARPIHEKSFN
jgi:hypothetical protein